MNRPDTAQATIPGAGSPGAAAIAIGVARIEMNGQPQRHIWSNAWLMAGVALGRAGLLIAAAIFAMSSSALREACPVLPPPDQKSRRPARQAMRPGPTQRAGPRSNDRPCPGLKRHDAKGASMDSPDPGDDYAEAFDRYAPVILRYARRRLENRDAAWDVVTDTFTSAWRHWARRPGPAELLPWLYAIAGNSVRDQRRSAERRRRLVARLSALHAPRHVADLAEGVVVGQDITDALARLSEADREILGLVAWEGQTDARTLGLVLGVSPGTARSRVHRAQRRLRAALDDASHPDTSQNDGGRDGSGRVNARHPVLRPTDPGRPGTAPEAGAACMTTNQPRQHVREA